jgi:NADH-quinone oxidoreductase subunit F
VPVGKKVLVVGGGNAAIDAARTALRLGAEVTIIYRRTRDQMPAYAEEIEEAVSEGVVLKALVQPTEVLRDSGGAVVGVRCVELSLGEFDRSGRRRPQRRESEPFDIEADQVIVAIGQRLDGDDLLEATAVKRDDDGFLRADPVTGQTAQEWIFSGGDAVLGPASVVEAIAAGERAAYGIDLYLTGEDHAFWRRDIDVDTAFDPDADPAPFAREPIETVPVERRRHNFCEVELPWSEAIAVRQARRCLRCDYGKTPAKEDVHA